MKLILVKHSLPEMMASVPSHDWVLSETGRRRALALANRLSAYSPPAIVSSPEPKALQTAAIVANRLGVPFSPYPGLHENDRRGIHP